MTLEERIARIEIALVKAGLMELSLAPTKDEILKELEAGDGSSLRDYLRRTKGKITKGWLFG